MPDEVSATNRAEAERLKALGNTHYQRNEYEEAYRYFTEAIEKNPKNAIYYANRAAVLMSMKRMTDAAYDCKTAVDIDPTYAKAWGRLGKASFHLSTWDESIRAYEKALECLPKDNLSDADRALRAEYAQGILQVKTKRGKIKSTATGFPKAQMASGEMPWDRAKAFMPTKTAQSAFSCVYILAYAHGDLMKATNNLRLTTIIERPGNNLCISTPGGIVVDLTNSILHDERCFHFGDGETLNKLFFACDNENLAWKGYFKKAGPAGMKADILKRLASNENYQDLRKSMTITVRCWICMAFLRMNLVGHMDYALESYANALDFLQWGQKALSHIEEDERGAVFSPSFVRGVKRLYLDAMREEIDDAARSNRKARFSPEEVLSLAKEIVEEVDADYEEMASKPRKLMYQSGHWYAYWIYPRANALASIGWYFSERAKKFPPGSSDWLLNFHAGGEAYLKAAECLPTDEEHRILFLRKYLDCLIGERRPLKDTLPVCERIRTTAPEVLDIWSACPTGGVRVRTILNEVQEFEKKTWTMLGEGECTKEDYVGMPQMFMPPDAGHDAIKFKDAFSRKERMKKYRSKVV